MEGRGCSPCFSYCPGSPLYYHFNSVAKSSLLSYRNCRWIRILEHSAAREEEIHHTKYHPACYNLTFLAQMLSSKSNTVKYLLSHLKKQNQDSRSSTTRFISPISKTNFWRDPCTCQNTKPVYRLLNNFFQLSEEVTWVTCLLLPVPLPCISLSLRQWSQMSLFGDCGALHISKWQWEWDGLSNGIQWMKRKTFS